MEVFGLPALIFFVYACYAFLNKPHLAAASVLAASVINAWFIDPPSIKIGLNIYIFDFVFVPVLLVAFIRLIFRHQWNYSSPALIIYGFIIFYGLFVGLKQFGTTAGVDFRNFFYYWVGALYFMSFPYSKEMISKITKYWLLICATLLVIVYFRFVADFLHLPIAATWIAADSTGVRFRVISSGSTYLLSVALVILFHRYVLPNEEKSSRILAVLFAVAIIVLQHRSVWAATIVAFASLFLVPGVEKHKVIGKLSTIGIVGVILLLPLLLFGLADSFINTISDSAERATNLHTGTFGGRMRAWDQIMGYWVKQDFVHQLLGDPFGAGYAGLPNSPHNFFFQSLLRGGILGNFLISLLYIGILLRFYFNFLNDKSNLFYPSLFFVIIIAQMVYYIPYSIQPEHGILVGIAASLAKRRIFSKNQKTSENTKYFLKTPGKREHVASA